MMIRVSVPKLLNLHLESGSDQAAPRAMLAVAAAILCSSCRVEQTSYLNRWAMVT